VGGGGAVDDGWVEVKAPGGGGVYYYHKLTRVSRWTKPDAAVTAKLNARLEAEQADVARRQAERLASISAAEAAAAEEKVEADRLQAAQAAAVAAWAEAAGWRGPKPVRKALKAGDPAAPLLPKRLLVELLASVHSVPGVTEYFPKPLMAAAGIQPGARDVAAASHPADALSAGVVKRAYLNAVKVLHPDKTTGHALLQRMTAQSAFTVVGAAWELYQEVLTAGGGGGGGEGGRPDAPMEY
jgi:hypothetical protein